MPPPTTDGAANGIVYVAAKHDRYVEAALLSAESVRLRYPNLPITLFTDRPGHSLCLASHFDDIRPVAGIPGIGSAWAEGQLIRLRCLPLSPYQRTLHLDSDTRVLTDELDWLFDRLADSDVAMVETAVDDSYSRRHVGRRMFNAGFVLYRRNSKTLAWLDAWATLSDQNFRAAARTPLPDVPALRHVGAEDVRRKLLNMDQVSLVELLSPDVNRFDLAVTTLDHSWNHRGSRMPANNRVKVRIVHAPALREMTIPDLIALEFSWRRAGRATEADVLAAYVADWYRGAGA